MRATSIRFPEKLSQINHAFTKVKNAPPTTTSKLQQEITMSIHKQYQIAVNASYETLNCLLDREIAVRRQVDLLVENASNYDYKKSVRLQHKCEGIVKVSYSLKEPFMFRQCNQLCLLSEEGKAKLVNLRSVLRGVHALQREKLGDI
jgi:hypothetical protein